MAGKKSGISHEKILSRVSGICTPIRKGRNLPILVLVPSTITEIKVSLIISHAAVTRFITAFTVKSILTTSHIYLSLKPLMLNEFDQSLKR